jgi:hypothetical protein
MLRRRGLSITAALALAATVVGEASAQTLAAYVESSGTEQKPRSNAGLSIHGGDWLQLRADVALRAAASSGNAARSTANTEVVPNLRSALTLAKNLDLETGVSFSEWNAGTDATFDTRLRYRKSLDVFVDQLDGSLWRSPDGLTKQSLRLGFNQALRDAAAIDAPTISGEALFEATQNPALATAGLPVHSRTVAVATRVTGLMSPFLAAHHSVTFKIEQTVGMRRESASTLSYDQAWTFGSLSSLGFNLELPRRTYSPADDFEPSIGLEWRGRF